MTRRKQPKGPPVDGDDANPPGKYGRPSLLTRETHDAIIANIRMGMSETMAAEAEGIERSTVTKWKARGRKDGKGPYFSFFTDLRQARPKFVKSNLAIIHKARVKDWRAAAWLLSKTTEEFADKQKVKVSGDPSEPPIQTQEVDMTADERLVRARAARAILDAMDADEKA